MATGGQRAAARQWAGADLRARWRSLVVLGVLAGVTGGIAFAAVAGARRTDTALERLRTTTNAADAAVFTSQVGVTRPDFTRLARRPEIKAIARWSLMFGEINRQPGGLLFGATDDVWGGVVDKAVPVKGRMFNPRAADEMVVDENAARSEHIHVGDVVDLHLYLVTQVDSGGPASGPHLRLRVVGVVRTIQQFLFTQDGLSMVSPAATQRYRNRPDVAILDNAYVQVHHPSRDMPALQRDVGRLVAKGTPVLDFGAVSRRVNTTLAVERSALALLAIAVAAAGLVLVGQALSRSSSVVAPDVTVLRAVGMTRGGITTAAVLPHIGAAAVGSATALATALIASRWFPVGLGARIDPDRGVHADWLVLAPGALALFVLVVAGAAFVAHRATTRAGAPSHRPRSPIARWVREKAPAPVGVGTAMAFEAGAGRTRVPVRPALIGAMVGVLGVAATITIDRGLDDALAHPERAGVTWDAFVGPRQSDITPSGVGLNKKFVARVLAAPNVAAAAVVDRQLISVNGVGVPTYSLRGVSGGRAAPIALTVTKGRAPTARGEVAIGPQSAKEVGVHVGDLVRVGRSPTRLRIVGQALFPSDVHAEFDQGLWILPDDYVASVPPFDPEQPTERGVAVRFREGVPAGRAIGVLTKDLGNSATGVSPPAVPSELTNLRNVRTLPVVLAVFLAFLALAAMLHVLATSARVRSRDFAILRAMGLTRRGTRAVLNSQGTAIAAVGLLVGIPLGIVAGRAAWSLVAHRVPLEDVSPFAAVAMALLIPGVALVANVVALLPGRRVARLRPAQLLRAE